MLWKSDFRLISLLPTRKCNNVLSVWYPKKEMHFKGQCFTSVGTDGQILSAWALLPGQAAYFPLSQSNLCINITINTKVFILTNSVQVGSAPSAACLLSLNHWFLKLFVPCSFLKEVKVPGHQTDSNKSKDVKNVKIYNDLLILKNNVFIKNSSRFLKSLHGSLRSTCTEGCPNSWTSSHATNKCNP